MARSNKSTGRGFAAMAEDDPDRLRQIASSGGEASSGKFEEGSRRASEAGKKGQANEPTAAKRKGGRHSRQDS